MTYYLVRANWSGIDKIKDFIQNQEWINGYGEDKFEQTIKEIQEGDILLLAKSSQILYFGEVIENPKKDGILKVKWHTFNKIITFNRYGAYIKTITKLTKKILQEYNIIDLIQEELKREKLFLETLKLENFTIFDNIELHFNKNINIFVGENSTGKTHILKLLYSILKMNNEDRVYNIIEDIFKVEPNNLITFGKNSFKIKCKLSEYSINFQIKENGLEIEKIPNYFLDKRAIFIPAKELLSFFEGFIGFYPYSSFDKTYYDLAEKLNLVIPKDAIYTKEEENIIKELENLLKAKVVMKNGRFYLEKDNNRVEINQIAEGFRKIATIVYLVANKSLKNSILIIDELEANLNPKYLKELIKIIYILSESGVQIFIATHSLFLLREFELLKRDNEVSYFNFYFENNALVVNSSKNLEELKNIVSLDENLYQSDRFLEKLNEIK